MFFYLSRFDGDGTSDNPFVPRIVQQNVGQWQAIDFRGDATQKTKGFCVVAVETRPATDPQGTLYLGDEFDLQLSNPVKQALERNLGVTFTEENTVRQVISAMLTKLADDNNPDRPNTLRADKGGHKIIHFANQSWEV